MKDILILGAGGHARVVIDAALATQNFNIIGFLDDGDVEEILGVKKLGSICELDKFQNVYYHIALGNNQLRENIGEKIDRERLATIVHPKAYLSRDVLIGNGCYIGANVVLNSKTILEDLVIVNTGSIIEHDCILKKASHISYGVLVGSLVEVSKKVYIDMGKIIKRGEIIERDIR
ncbi:acetyltransferase (plasmid) [Cetobacterium somerae]|uniref:acetyltransferase n=1 Tax=Cetobacterium somerae TaxID=188913 RepID=UPI003D76681C